MDVVFACKQRQRNATQGIARRNETQEPDHPVLDNASTTDPNQRWGGCGTLQQMKIELLLLKIVF